MAWQKSGPQISSAEVRQAEGPRLSLTSSKEYKTSKPRDAPERRSRSISEGVALRQSAPLQLVPVLAEIQTYAKDFAGSKFLQGELAKKGGPALITEALIPHLQDVCTDKFGTFLVQKLVSVADAPTRRRLVTAFSQVDMLGMLCDMPASRVIQATLDVATPKQTLEIVTQLSGHVSDCAFDSMGSFGLIKCFEVTRADFIVQEAVTDFEHLAKDKQGCLVIKAILRSGQRAQAGTILRTILDSEGLVELASDRYGGYVVQAALLRTDCAEVGLLLTELVAEITSLSTTKFGSSVMEECIKMASEQHIDQIAGWLVENSHHLHLLNDDYFGKWVVKTLMARASEERREDMLQLVEVVSHALEEPVH